MIDDKMFDTFRPFGVNGCASHLPVLYYLGTRVKVASVFEFGCGVFSTQFFVDWISEVESVEMQHQEWYDKIKLVHGQCEKFKISCMIGPEEAIDYFSSLSRRWDMVFVDGHGESRWKAVNSAFNKTDLIVAHDTEDPRYHWDRVAVPAYWHRLDFKQLPVWTTVFVKQGHSFYDEAVRC